MKKKFLLSVFVFFLCCECVIFEACSNKDQNNPNSTEINGSSVKNEFGAGRLLIGKWDASSGYVFCFKSDGDCYRDWYSGGAKVEGIWSYDSETKVLSTTVGSSYTMNLISSQGLQGVSLGNGKGSSFKHSIGYVDNNDKLIVGKGRTKEGKELIFENNGNCTTGDSKGTYKIYRSNNKTTISFDMDGNYNQSYTLRHLSGGLIMINPNDKNSTNIIGGEYYYTSE